MNNEHVSLPTESNKDEPDIYDSSMIAVYDYIVRTCDQKTSCDLEIPDYTAVQGTSYNCRQRFPDIASFHLRGVYLDITCARRKLDGFVA